MGLFHRLQYNPRKKKGVIDYKKDNNESSVSFGFFSVDDKKRQRPFVVLCFSSVVFLLQWPVGVFLVSFSFGLYNHESLGGSCCCC